MRSHVPQIFGCHCALENYWRSFDGFKAHQSLLFLDRCYVRAATAVNLFLHPYAGTRRPSGLPVSWATF